jgi:hypothetical protein
MTKTRLSRREAVSVLVEAHRLQRPTIIPLDRQMAVQMPYELWGRVIEALKPLSEPEEGPVVQARVRA